MNRYGACELFGRTRRGVGRVSGLTGAIAGGLLGTLAPQSHADVAVTLSIPPGAAREVQYFPVSPGLAVWIDAERERLEREALQKIGSRRHVNSDVVLRDFTVHLGSARVVHPAASTYTVTLQDNALDFTSTVPGPTTRGMDPRFRARFNVVVDLTLTVPSERDPQIRVLSAHARVPKVKIEGLNVTGDISVAALAVANFFSELATGTNLLSEVIGDRLATDLTARFESELRPVNETIALQKRTTGVRIVGHDFDAARSATIVRLTGLSTQLQVPSARSGAPAPLPVSKPTDVSKPRRAGSP